MPYWEKIVLSLSKKARRVRWKKKVVIKVVDKVVRLSVMLVL
jgi:hypothetical protein